jgi:NADPH-dependent 2,4-dienoyl-CoA reductase/sulfur reductase-like enzyme
VPPQYWQLRFTTTEIIRMKIAYVVLCVAGAGLIGGLLNAYFAEKGFVLPR